MTFITQVTLEHLLQLQGLRGLSQGWGRAVGLDTRTHLWAARQVRGGCGGVLGKGRRGTVDISPNPVPVRLFPETVHQAHNP